MSDPRNPFNYPINPSFGKGIYRRKIRLVNHADRVQADLEDCNHGFSVTLHHNGAYVTKIEGQHHRIPFTTCGGAITPLQSLVGISLPQNLHSLTTLVNARQHCTHWLDLCLLAILHSTREEIVRTYDIEVPDENNEPTLARIFVNQLLVHEWCVKDWIISQPQLLADKTLFRGFSSWANAAFINEDDKQAAFALQKGYFVSRARRFDIDKLDGESATAHTMMAGACYSYSEPQATIAKRTVKTTRDFTDIPEALLQFKKD